jgi:glycosyltransferase involved in cell wall biosynthesis
MFSKYTSLIIPTRNRNKFLYKILSQLKNYKIKFQEILVIDSSDKFDNLFVNKICKKFSVKFFCSKPSTSLQRNLGLKLRNKRNRFIMFLDDDISFYKNSFFNMNNIINLYKKNDNISGFGFNLITRKEKNLLDIFKTSTFVKIINLYSNKPGVVTKSGWHTKVSNLESSLFADWFSTSAVIYKSKFLNNIKFNKNFGQYSYLEDLDFSLKINKRKRKILIDHSSRYKHPNEITRNNFSFGIIEIFNRFIVVKNNNLNLKLFFLGSFIRFFISLFNLLKGELNSLSRALGNIIGILKSIFYVIFYGKKKFNI